MKNKTNVKAAGQLGTCTLTAFLAIAALTMSLPAAGQDQTDKPQNQCKNETYAAANPSVCGKQKYQGTNNGSSSTPYESPCKNKQYADTHSVECRSQSQSSGKGQGPNQTCVDNSCGPLDNNPPSLASQDDAGYGGGLGGEGVIGTTLPPKEIKAVKRKPTNTTALCHDGFYTTTTDRNVACSKHGGINTWLLK
jgi:hypothetical protein